MPIADETLDVCVTKIRLRMEGTVKWKSLGCVCVHVCVCSREQAFVCIGHKGFGTELLE